MVNFLDPIRSTVDALDTKMDAVIKQIDAVKSFPFIGAMVAPYVSILDELGTYVDMARQAIDALDPVATAAVAASPPAIAATAVAATTAATAVAPAPILGTGAVDPSAKVT